MKTEMKCYGWRAPKAIEDARLKRLIKAYRCRNRSHLIDVLLTEADEKILSKNSTTGNVSVSMQV